MNVLFLNSPIFTWVIVPLLIFIARILDVSIGTIRIIMVSKGSKILAPILGFFEVIIWLLAISQVMQHLSNIACFIAYGFGFAMGNYVGIVIEEKIALGLQAVRFITKDTVDVLTMALRDEGYGATVIEATGGKGKVNIIFSIVPRKNIDNVLILAREIDPNVFVSTQDIRSVKSGFIPSKSTIYKWKKLAKKK
ncbi:MAG: DUF2179 domain-containing protein [Candidatus Marinimicrobia bacterium]|nr:DUF2179 domain-containing protein [Candidatus Neomarinimicrobiota bacterium]